MSSAREGFLLLLTDMWGSGRDRPLARDAGAGESGLLLALDRQENRHLLAPVAADFVFTESTGDNLKLTDWRFPGSGQRYLDLMCTSPSLAGTFNHLADDVIGKVVENELSPALALQQTLAEWRRLLREAATLSEEKLRGLFGELVTLRELAQLNPYQAISTWAGPQGGRHDFISTAGDIEVKTSAGEGLAVVISDLAQLDQPDQRDLVLVRHQVMTDPTGTSLEALVDELCELGLVREELTGELARVGFIPGAQMPETRFHLVDTQRWRVNEEFPGLRSSDLPHHRRDGIRKITYTLDLTGAGDPLSDEQYGAFLRRMIGGMRE